MTTATLPERTYWDDVVANRGPAIAGVLVYVGWLIVGTLDGSDGVPRYAPTVPLLAAAVIIANHHVGFSRGILWGFIVWEFTHMAGGLIPFPDRHILYNVAWPIPIVRWDRLVHAFGFGLATAASWQAIRRLLPPGHGATRSVAFLAALAGLGFGLAIELVEFLMTLVTTTNVGDYVDTGWDLVFDALGAIAVAMWLVMKRGPGSTSQVDDEPVTASSRVRGRPERPGSAGPQDGTDRVDDEPGWYASRPSG